MMRQRLASLLLAISAGAALIGQITQLVDGNGGALLFAATSTTPFDRVVVSSTDDFAIAQIREASALVPEPGSALNLLVAGAIGLVGVRLRAFRLR